jgi:tetratricopeptide (TPR) repeat protein
MSPMSIRRGQLLEPTRAVIAAMRIAAGLLLWIIASGLFVRAEVCRAPESMKARLQDHPTADTYTDLGIWFGQQQKYACAADAFASSLSIEPYSANVAFMFGTSLYFSGNAQEAIAALQMAEKLDGRNEKVHLILASAFDQLHQVRDAETEWRYALAIDPESSGALDHLSQDLMLDQDYAGTIALLENPIVQGQRTGTQSLNLGLAYAATNKFDEAAKVLREGLNTSPDSLALADSLFDVLVQLDRSEEATIALGLALELHPTELDSEVRHVQTLLATQSEQINHVVQGLLATDSSNWKVLYLNGALEVGERKLERARAHLEQSIALNPNFAASHAALGSVLAQLNDPASAKEQLERAITLGDDTPEVEENLSRVSHSLSSAR